MKSSWVIVGKHRGNHITGGRCRAHSGTHAPIQGFSTLERTTIEGRPPRPPAGSNPRPFRFSDRGYSALPTELPRVAGKTSSECIINLVLGYLCTLAPVAAGRVVANPPFELQTSIAQTPLRGLNSACALCKNMVGRA